MRRAGLAFLLGVLCACGDDPQTPTPDAGTDAGDATDVPTDTSEDVRTDAADAADADDTGDLADSGDAEVDAPDAGPVEFMSTPDLIAQAGIEWAYELDLSGTAETSLSLGPEGAALEFRILTWTPPTTAAAGARRARTT